MPMGAQQILLPVDVAKCPLGVFDVVNRMARGSQVIVILLHVVTLDVVAAENRIYEELSREAQSYLGKLASSYLRTDIVTRVRVRLGKAGEQILAEASGDRPELIVLPVVRASTGNERPVQSCNRHPATVSALARKVIRGANCDVLVIPFNTHLDCEEAWGRPVVPTGHDESVLHSPASPLALSLVDRGADSSLLLPAETVLIPERYGSGSPQP